MDVNKLKKEYFKASTIVFTMIAIAWGLIMIFIFNLPLEKSDEIMFDIGVFAIAYCSLLLYYFIKVAYYSIMWKKELKKQIQNTI